MTGIVIWHEINNIKFNLIQLKGTKTRQTRPIRMERSTDNPNKPFNLFILGSVSALAFHINNDRFNEQLSQHPLTVK